MQYDKSSIKSINIGFEKKVFISAADFKYPTLKLRDLKELNVQSISADDCILFMWTNGGGSTITPALFRNMVEEIGFSIIFRRNDRICHSYIRSDK